MKIIDSKGLVVRVGGTIHVTEGGVIHPPTPPDMTPIYDALTSLGHQIDDNDERLNDFTDVSPDASWSATATYTKDSVLRHNGATWLATVDTLAGEEPGVSSKWGSLTLESLFRSIAALTARVAALETP